MTQTIYDISIRDLNLGEEVQTCLEKTPLSKVVEIMRKFRIGSIIVVKDFKPVGIFTERDFLLKLASKDIDLDKEVIGDFMTRHPVCLSVDDSLFKVMRTMNEGGFRHIVITDKGGTVRKVLSIKDVMSYLTKWLDERKPT